MGKREYIATCDSDLMKVIIKIRLHICELKKLSKKRRTYEMPYEIECQTAEADYRIKENTPNQWAELVKIYRKNKELRR